MADLPRNTQFKDNASAISQAIKSSVKLGRSLPARGARTFSQPRPTGGPVQVPRGENLSAEEAIGRLKQLGTVTVPFGGSTRYEGFHPGVDVANKRGTNIPAFAGGKVVDIRTGQVRNPNVPSFGNYVIIEDNKGNRHRYSHLNQSYVRVGQTVPRGSFVGSMGATGSTYSTSGGDPSHLDYRIRDAFGKHVNPFTYLSSFYKQ